MKKHIAIIEDDISINNGIALAIGKDEYQFSSFCKLKDVKDLEKMDLVILDINLPDGNGLDFLREFRRTSQVPVLILTANDTEMDEVTGLQLGADDYVTKPFSLMVLRLRVEKLLNRSKQHKVYENNALYFDFKDMIFRKSGQEIELSKTEMRLLHFLVENEGLTVTRDRLLDYVWQNQEFVDENALSVTIKRLRDKLETKEEKYIHTVYGVGYVWKLA
ncbi:response regulator transcription factor [Anaerosporobacter sp.]|uniref:response regulator transcription factor n=1 Tax=Anaerosporobacter sp. TaxID=1872529 RepID=UPI00286F8538|nr:response regulator transcription factor [Anaerosporobacter sp.]